MKIKTKRDETKPNETNKTVEKPCKLTKTKLFKRFSKVKPEKKNNKTTKNQTL